MGLFIIMLALELADKVRGQNNRLENVSMLFCKARRMHKATAQNLSTSNKTWLRSSEVEFLGKRGE